jgi:hypothetical protein
MCKTVINAGISMFIIIQIIIIKIKSGTLYCEVAMDAQFKMYKK